jgi:uncharacterized protein YyaL (SSP411 family)
MRYILLLIAIFFGNTLAHTPKELQKVYMQKGLDYQPRTRHLINDKAKFTNHLILANSPYLLQHAHNPVNWHNFNNEAFKLAKSQNKLIFLSIGYATCHWCHVMEEESFEDLEVSKILNKNYIAIKVDREVMPDVDTHFMNAIQLISGSGGWPLNVILTPGGNVFYGGTYFPKNTLISTLEKIQSFWKTDKKQIFTTALNIKNALRHKKTNKTILTNDLQERAVKMLLQDFDIFLGGFGSAPKFPNEVQLLTLIESQMRQPNPEKLNAIRVTLDNMASGGLYDIVAGGFARYATDNAWIFPHFEKMLYNQAQLAMVYIKAFELTQDPLYRRVFTQTLDYTLREMQHKNGGFYSATDADSNGKEGLFFIWTKQELQTILGHDFKIFKHYFDLSSSTEFDNAHILHYHDFSALTAIDFEKIDPLLKKLYLARQIRKKPLLDNKILLSWNALLLKSLIIASKYDKKYLLEAEKLSKFLIQNFYQKALQRVQIDGKTSQQAIFEDYAYFANALLALFDNTQNPLHLKVAKNLTNEALDKFWDKQNHGFNISNNSRIQNNIKSIYDGAILSPNGLMYHVLNQLFERTQQTKYQNFASQLIKSFSTEIERIPSIYGSIVNAYTALKQGNLDDVIYAYQGKIKILSGNGRLQLNIKKGWHINSEKPLQQSLIATTLTSGHLKNIHYPPAKTVSLGFSSEKLQVYEGDIVIKYTLKSHQFTLGALQIQACSDKVCLPPTKLLVKL